MMRMLQCFFLGGGVDDELHMPRTMDFFIWEIDTFFDLVCYHCCVVTKQHASEFSRELITRLEEGFSLGRFSKLEIQYPFLPKCFQETVILIHQVCIPILLCGLPLID